MKRHYNGRYRIDYFKKTLPVLLMFWTAVAGLGFKTSNIIVEAWGDTPVDHAEKVQISPTPTPQLAIIEPTIMPTATPTPTGKQEIINEIVRVFGDDAPNAFNVLYCENRTLNPEAVNWNSNGTWDAGIFQVNQVHGYTMEQMKDYKQNIKAAKKIFDGRGWTAWSCSHRVDITPFWKE